MAFEKRWMTIPEVSAYFGFSRSYTYELIQDGAFTVLRPGQATTGKGLRISVESVKRFECDRVVKVD